MSRKSKIVIEEKARITREYTVGNISREEAARRAGVDHDVILFHSDRGFQYTNQPSITNSKKSV